MKRIIDHNFEAMREATPIGFSSRKAVVDRADQIVEAELERIGTQG